MNSVSLVSLFIGIAAILVGVGSTSYGVRSGSLVNTWLGGFNVAAGIYCILMAAANG